MSDGPVLGGALPPLHRYAACTNVAAACASAAFQVFPCRNSYRDILAFSGLCFSFDAYRWHQDHAWGFGGNEFLDEHWDDVARATGVRLRRYPGGREGSPLAEHREEILRGFAAGLPLIGQAAGACPFAVGVGCAEDAPPMQLWWNVRFVAYGAVTEANGLFRAPGTALALLQGYEPPAWSPEEEVRHCLRASGAVRAPLDLGW